MTRFAPAPGTSADFDEIAKKTREGLDAAGNPEGIDDEALREMLARRFAEHGNKTWPHEDEPDEVLHKVDVPVAQVRELVVPAVPDEPYWYEDPDQAEMFDHYILSRRQLGARVQGGLLITGPAGVGKTKGVVKAIERINRERGLSIPLLVMNCPTVNDPGKWFGTRHIDANGDRYEKSAFITAVETGGVILLDEFMRLHPTIHNPVMSLMDATEAVLLSDLNLLVTRHPETIFVGTTNVGAAFGGTHRMDWAMRERWSFTIERDFPPLDEEVRILTTNNPGCSSDAAMTLVTIADKSRQMYLTGDIRSPISTRTLDNAAFLVASGMTERNALRWTAIPEYDGNADGGTSSESDREKVKRIIEGRTRRTDHRSPVPEPRVLLAAPISKP